MKKVLINLFKTNEEDYIKFSKINDNGEEEIIEVFNIGDSSKNVNSDGTVKNLDSIYDYIIENVEEILIEKKYETNNDYTKTKIANAFVDSLNEEIDGIKNEILDLTQTEGNKQ